MAAADPFVAASSPRRLLPRTLGPAASAGTAAASPSTARGSLLDGVYRPLKGSKELVEQVRMAMKERGDAGKLDHSDGAEVAAVANGKNNQLGRRPAVDRKRFRFNAKPPRDNPVQNVDFSELLNIEDPDEYFATLDQLEKADKEIKRLRGEVPTEATYNDRAIELPKKRPGLLRRKSVHSYKFSASVDTPDAIETSSSQTETITEYEFAQVDVHASAPKMPKEPVSSRSSQHAIPDTSVRKDSFVGKDNIFTLNYLLSAFKDLDETGGENLLRETLQIKEISTGKVCLPDFNVPGDIPPTVHTNSMNCDMLERTVPGSSLARISQLEKRVFVEDAREDKHTDLSKDDESDWSPESLLCKRSPMRRSSDTVVLPINEGFTAIKTPSPSIKSPEHVLEPEPNPPEGVATGRPMGSSPIGVNRDSESVKERGTSCRHSVLLEEDDMPIDCTVSSHHLESVSTEVLSNTPSRNVPPLNHGDGNSEHQEMVGGDVAQDNPIHTSEIPPEDTYPQNQSEIHRGNIEKLAIDTRNSLSPSEGKEQRGKKKKQPSKRGKRVGDNTTHTLDIPPEDTYPHNQSEIHRGNTEKLAVDTSNVLSSSEGKERGKRKQQPSKRVAGEAGDLEIPAPNFEPENQPDVLDTDVEQQPACISHSPSPSNGKRQNEVRKRNKKQDLNRRKSLADAGLTWQSGVRRSTRIRSEPLKHWLGERFVYGRIHGSNRR
ncbi:centromere protein C isoform X2 [Oryza brachyantha]|uniref:centromere protein C isoform X2 n=1 Tax=Oryza brachyantha TaxID=4533 RepID=UPI001ADBD2FD|nr:centromere protein C isoform X2 [Oryza brachyantha]